MRKDEGTGILGLSPVANATIFAIDRQNKVAGYATIRFNGVAGSTTLNLANLRGEQVLSRSVTAINGVNSVTLETGSLPAGTYLLRIGSAAGSTTTIVTVTH